ncbi:hypothetical protein [Streptococcus gallinaceus]|uniref:Uncharacterized protein n=1 Tax=Streptococcus gallinaceus TaxID=165758 RepID=A0ABV2JIM4_9STRE
MVQVKKEVTKKAAGKLGKAAGVLNTVFSVIPDTVAIVGDITAKAAPIVDKHLEYNRAYKERLIQVPNLLDIPVKEAKRLLEERDFGCVDHSGQASFEICASRYRRSSSHDSKIR